MNLKLSRWCTYESVKDTLEDVCSLGPEASFAAEEIVGNAIVKHQLCFSGEYHQYGEYGVPVVVDLDTNKEYMFLLSWRSWGSLMATCHNKIEKSKKYNYMDFYMDLVSKENKVPGSEKEYVDD